MEFSGRGTQKWSRTLHVYLTLVAFLMMLFFAATGFVMNHSEWFESTEPATSTAIVNIPTALLAGEDRLPLVEYLRAKHGAAGEVTEFRRESDSVHVQFKSPGHQTEAAIQTADGAATITHESRGLFGLVADMHRGKNTGSAWRFVIDITASLLVLGALTGFILWLALPKRRKIGMVGLGLSLAVCAGLFFLATR